MHIYSYILHIYTYILCKKLSIYAESYLKVDRY
jgi:hypothetical protein